MYTHTRSPEGFFSIGSSVVVMDGSKYIRRKLRKRQLNRRVVI